MGVSTAGDTIPAGDLRGAAGGGIAAYPGCRFAVTDPDGAVVVTDDDYASRWGTLPLLGLQPGDTIDTSGCGWVPATAARALPATGAYPLLPGDVPVGQVRAGCDLLHWDDREPGGGRDWDTALGPARATAIDAGTQLEVAGVVWPDCG